jgi:excisionase family DNA binding protein
MSSRIHITKESSRSNVASIRANKEPVRMQVLPDGLLTDRDVSALTGLDRVTLYRLRNARKIGFYKFGKVIRYSREQIREFLEHHEKQARD